MTVLKYREKDGHSNWLSPSFLLHCATKFGLDEQAIEESWQAGSADKLLELLGPHIPGLVIEVVGKQDVNIHAIARAGDAVNAGGRHDT